MSLGAPPVYVTLMRANPPINGGAKPQCQYFNPNFCQRTMQGVPYELLVDKTTYHIQLNIGDIFVKALLH